MDTFVTMAEAQPVITKAQCTIAEAEELITKFRGGDVWLCVHGELPIVDSDNKMFPSYTTIRVTKREAKRLVRALLGEVLESRGGRIRLKIYDWPDGRRGLYIND